MNQPKPNVFSAVRKFHLAAMLWLVACAGLGELCAGEADSSRFFGAKPGSLARAKARLAAGDADLKHALKELMFEADAALKESPPTVTAKSKVPPSGDQHDYMSLAPYYWPDPKSSNGLPYLRRDGQVNPESRDLRVNDGPRVKLLGNSIETLALAYYFSTNEAYAAHAAQFARVWFLDPATRMNPHFQFAQAVPGENDGRGTGIIEARSIAAAADALGLLAGCKSWPAADQKALQDWLVTFLDWLLTSEPGRKERAAKNNHGTWFDVQTAKLALCLGRTDQARQIIEEARQTRVAVQIEPDGRQPLELSRATSYGYSCFNLQALADLATLGEHAGVDLWRFQTSDGRSIRRALEFMLPYADRPSKQWPYPQIKERHQEAMLPLLRRAALELEAPEFERVLAKYADASASRNRLFLVR